MIDDRLIDIEIKLTQQEDAVEELNKVICEQQKRIEQLEAICTALINHVKGLSEAAGEENQAQNETPPHY
ncbi:MAG: SlyX family protein [Betaproteobacteria bacterium]|nr:SlyX family protein [Betaproteobacteria bacterium]